MSNKKIRNMSDMPKWFSLDKYNGTESFTAADWAEQLGHRRQIEWMLGRHKLDINNDAVDMFEEIKRDPTQTLSFPSSPLLPDSASFSAYVQPLKCGLVRALASDIENHYGLDESGSLGAAADITVSSYFKDNEVYMDSLVPVIIDLNGSDVDVRNDFDRYLKQARTIVGIESKKIHINQREFEKLQDYCMLPYIDLLIWEKISGYKISASVILDMLFMDRADRNGDEKFITDTIKPFSQKIDDKFIRSLKSRIK